jgi:hypothetical protein
LKIHIRKNKQDRDPLCGGTGQVTTNWDLVTCRTCLNTPRDPVTASKDGYRLEIEQAVREDLARQGVLGAHDPEQVRIESEPHATDGEPWTELERDVWVATFGAAVAYGARELAQGRAHEAVRQLRKLGPGS